MMTTIKTRRANKTKKSKQKPTKENATTELWPYCVKIVSNIQVYRLGVINKPEIQNK